MAGAVKRLKIVKVVGPLRQRLNVINQFGRSDLAETGEVPAK